jgi:predicted membrane GTPase involved in stress response
MTNALEHFTLDTSEAYLGDITRKLNSLGAWIDDLEDYSGAIRLTFRAPEKNMRGFELWLGRATDGIAKVQRNV